MQRSPNGENAACFFIIFLFGCCTMCFNPFKGRLDNIQINHTRIKFFSGDVLMYKMFFHFKAIQLHELEIRCLPNQILSSIKVDISSVGLRGEYAWQRNKTMWVTRRRRKNKRYNWFEKGTLPRSGGYPVYQLGSHRDC